MCSKRVQHSFAEKRRLGASLDNLDAVVQDEGTNKSLGAPGTSVRIVRTLGFCVISSLADKHCRPFVLY